MSEDGPQGGTQRLTWARQGPRRGGGGEKRVKGLRVVATAASRTPNRISTTQFRILAASWSPEGPWVMVPRGTLFA